MPKIVIYILSIFVILLVLVITVSYTANVMFNQKVSKEVREFFKDSKQKPTEIIKKADLEGLPPCVQRWLEHSQIIGKERIRTARLKQKAVMRTTLEKPWMPTVAEQYFTIDEPRFIWKAKIKAAPLFHIVGRDKYLDGKGNMLIKAMSLFTLADSRGIEMDQGTLIRYLAETVWFPTAALNNYITWEEIDANSARATMSYQGVTASGVFTFNEEGDFVSFDTKRYRDVNGKFFLENWSASAQGYKEFNGIRIPTKGVVIWKLKTGDFPWFQWELEDIEYNKPMEY